MDFKRTSTAWMKQHSDTNSMVVGTFPFSNNFYLVELYVWVFIQLQWCLCSYTRPGGRGEWELICTWMEVRYRKHEQKINFDTDFILEIHKKLHTIGI